MKYVKLFENFEDSDSEKSLINSSVEGALVDLLDDGLIVNCNIIPIKNRASNIRISDRNRNKDYKISSYKENFNFLYDILKEYNYSIFTVSVNSRTLENDKGRIEQFSKADFEYMWRRIIESSHDIFLSINFSVFKD